MTIKKTPAFIAAAVALVALPLLAQQLGNGPVRIMDLALLYVMLALGLNIVVGYAGLLDLGYVAFYAVGSYMFALLASPHLAENFAWMHSVFPNGLHMPIWLVMKLMSCLTPAALRPSTSFWRMALMRTRISASSSSHWARSSGLPSTAATTAPPWMGGLE
jgi:ABC-type branched-subunit amino acid transport system permease subunit